MGADVFLESYYNTLQARLQPEFEAAVKRRDSVRSTKARDEAQAEIVRIYDAMHPPSAYFRDSYSGSCLLAQLSLSWWHHVAPRLTEDDHLPLKDVRWLLDEVRNRRLSCQSEATYEQQVTREVMTQLAGGNVQIDQKVVYTADDVEWFVSRKQALITFLVTALELGEEPVCSL